VQRFHDVVKLEFLPLHGWLQISMSCSREEGLVGKIDQPRGFGEDSAGVLRGLEAEKSTSSAHTQCRSA
jgi:hypothetical protein